MRVAAEDKGDISKQCSRAAERPVPVLKNADPAVLETLRGSYKLLVGRHLPTVLEWLSLAVKVPICRMHSAIPLRHLSLIGFSSRE